MENSLQVDRKKMERKENALVSIWMPTYCAGEYVREALESILTQETDYRYEIVISDDCSKDNTWEIISEYAEKYPDIISAARNETNLGLSKNVLKTKMGCKGKYIVNLSGDDYWIDRKKIQKQADFLEEHSDYVGVGTQVEIRYNNLKKASSSYPAHSELGKDFTKESYNRGVNLPSHGFMIRNIFADPEKKALIDKVYGVSATVDDLYDPVLYLEFGKIFIMKEASCVYRVPIDKNGEYNFNSMTKPLEKAMMLLEGYSNLEKLKMEGVDLKKRFCSVFNLVILNGIRSGNFKSIGQAYERIPLRYRKPWYGGVAVKCAFSVWHSGFKHLKERLRKMKSKNNV